MPKIAGTPTGGTAVAGTDESALRWRTGWTLGAGIEVPFAPDWTAKLEYLFTHFGITSVNFPAGGQRFDSDLRMHELRLGVNYNFGSNAENGGGFLTDRLSIHGQTTYVNQYAPPFRAPYAPPDEDIAAGFLAGVRRDAAAEARIDACAGGLIAAIRARAGGLGGIEDFLREYSLTTGEGLALMHQRISMVLVDPAVEPKVIENSSSRIALDTPSRLGARSNSPDAVPLRINGEHKEPAP